MIPTQALPVDVKGYENFYTISNDGKVWSKRKKAYLSPETTNGYERVVITKDKVFKHKLVHRIVALHFVDGYFEGAVVNHIDGDKTNNHFSNLEWCTQSHNIMEAFHTTKTKDNATKGMQSDNTSGYIGVMKQDGVYCVQIRHKKKTIHSKYGFKTAIEGAKYRDKYLDDNNLPHTRSL
jgi:hypothetical protein